MESFNKGNDMLGFYVFKRSPCFFCGKGVRRAGHKEGGSSGGCGLTLRVGLERSAQLGLILEMVLTGPWRDCVRPGEKARSYRIPSVLVEQPDG